MEAQDALFRLGGTAARASLVRHVSPRTLERALDAGAVVRDGHGRYSLPTVSEALRIANGLSGTVSHLSAAQHWGWEVKAPPPRPHVTVPRTRRIDRDRRQAAVLHWSDLAPEDVRDPGVTSPGRTLVDCRTTCDFDEALAVVDSALRHGTVLPETLKALTGFLRGPGSASARRVASAADPRAANPFESVLRAVCLGVRGLQVVPQVRITDVGFHARPDLVDQDLRLVLEA